MLRDKLTKRQEILAAATRMFLRYGYSKTTIEDISAAADKSKTAVYYYFKGKQEIFREVLDAEFGQIQESLRKIRLGSYPSPFVQIREYLRLRMDLIRAAGVYCHHILTGSDDGEVRGIISEVRSRFDGWELEYFKAVCSKGHEDGILSEKVKPESFGQMLAMLLKGLETQFIQSPDPDSTRVTCEAVLDRVLLGFTVKTN